MLIRWLWTLEIAAAVGHCGFGQTTVVLRTEQTYLEVRAAETSPQVGNLGSGANSWRNEESDRLLGSVVIDGRSVPVRWNFNANASRIENRDVAFVYDAASPKLRLIWEWRARAAIGPIEHTIHIENLAQTDIWIPMQDSFGFRFGVDPNVRLEQFYVEKGADKPSAVGTHRDVLLVGGKWTGRSSTYAHPGPGEPREIIPFFAIENAGAGSGWYAGVEFSGRTRLSVERGVDSIHGAVGLNSDPGPFRSRLKPGETFDTPTVFCGGLHRWYRRFRERPTSMGAAGADKPSCLGESELSAACE